jgi:hypothetical protein
MKINKKAETMLLILLIGTVSSIIFHYTRFAFIGNKAPFLDTFLHNPINIFCDYYSIDDGFSRFGYKITLFYFPFTFFVLGSLQKIAVNNPYLLMQILLGIYFILLVPIIFKSLNSLEIRLRIICVFTLIFLNYPMLHALHTGNFETICFICFLYSLAFARHDSPVIAAIMLAPAIAIKAYPIIFILTFIDKNNYKRVLFAMFFSTIFFILIGFIFKGNYVENIKDYLNGVVTSYNNYSSIMVSSTSGLAFGHSIANTLKIIFPYLNTSTLIHPIITIIGIPIFLYSCYLAYRVNFLIYKIILPLTALCLFTPTSTDYRLLYFTLPVIIIINNKTDFKFSLHYLIMICLLLIPKDYYFFNGDLYQNTNSIFNTLLLLFLLLFTIKNTIILNKSIQK